MKLNKIYTSIILVISIIIVVNFLSDEISFRYDATDNNQFTLSKATKNILKEISEPITIKAYFSEGLIPQLTKTRQDFKDMLIEFSELSDKNVVFEFINPNADEEQEQKALQAGIQQNVVNVREKDQVKQQKAYFGAVIESGDSKEVIPIIQPDGIAMEYNLATSIKKIISTNKPTIAIIQGNGEPAVDNLPHVLHGLSVLYNVTTLNLNNEEPISPEYKTIAIIGTKDSIPENQLKKLDDYLNKGGKIFIAINRVDGNFQNATGSAVNTRLETWLMTKGIKVDDNFIVDKKCGAVTAQQQQGIFTVQRNVPFPYLPIISNFADHPITKGLEAVILQFASTIDYVGDTSAKFIPFAFTSDNSGFIRPPLFFDINKEWTNADYPQKKLVVGAALERIGGNPNAKMVIISDGDFPVSAKNQQPNPDNISLMVNSIDWLSDDTGLIELRTKGVITRPIDELADSRKLFLKYFNFGLPILLVFVLALISYQYNRSKRIRRQLTKYSA